MCRVWQPLACLLCQRKGAMVAAWSFVLAASVGAPAEQLLPRADGTKAAAIAAASGVAAGVDAAHPSGVGNCISVSASVPDFWCGQQTSPPANLCKCGDDRLTAEAQAKVKAKAKCADGRTPNYLMCHHTSADRQRV